MPIFAQTQSKHFKQRIHKSNPGRFQALQYTIDPGNLASSPLHTVKSTDGPIDWNTTNPWQTAQPEWPNLPTTAPATTPAWVDPTPPKTAEELQKELIDNALAGWPWTGVGEQLTTIVPNLLTHLHFIVQNTDILSVPILHQYISRQGSLSPSSGTTNFPSLQHPEKRACCEEAH